MNDNLASKYLLLMFGMIAVVAFLGEQNKLIGGVFMSNDWKDDGVMIHYKQDFIEIDSHSLDRLMNDQARLEWLVKNGWDARFSRPDWRDAIDEAMGNDEL